MSSPSNPSLTEKSIRLYDLSLANGKKQLCTAFSSLVQRPDGSVCILSLQGAHRVFAEIDHRFGVADSIHEMYDSHGDSQMTNKNEWARVTRCLEKEQADRNFNVELFSPIDSELAKELAGSDLYNEAVSRDFKDTRFLFVPPIGFEDADNHFPWKFSPLIDDIEQRWRDFTRTDRFLLKVKPRENSLHVVLFGSLIRTVQPSGCYPASNKTIHHSGILEGSEVDLTTAGRKIIVDAIDTWIDKTITPSGGELWEDEEHLSKSLSKSVMWALQAPHFKVSEHTVPFSEEDNAPIVRELENGTTVTIEFSLITPACDDEQSEGEDENGYEGTTDAIQE